MNIELEKNLGILIGSDGSGATAQADSGAKIFRLPRVEISMNKAYAEFYPTEVEKSFQYMLDNDSMSITVSGKALRTALEPKRAEADTKLALIKAEMTILVTASGELPNQAVNNYEVDSTCCPSSPRYDYQKIREVSGSGENDNWEIREANIKASPEASAMERYNNLAWRCDELAMESAVIGTAIRTLDDSGKYKMTIRQATRLGL